MKNGGDCFIHSIAMAGRRAHKWDGRSCLGVRYLLSVGIKSKHGVLSNPSSPYPLEPYTTGGGKGKGKGAEKATGGICFDMMSLGLTNKGRTFRPPSSQESVSTVDGRMLAAFHVGTGFWNRRGPGDIEFSISRPTTLRVLFEAGYHSRLLSCIFSHPAALTSPGQ